jgi:hypothetical protein
MWTVVPHIYNVVTAPNIQDPIFNCSYLRCYSRYLDNSMCVIMQTWCQIQRTSSSLRYLNCCPVHIQCNYSTTFSGFNIQLNLSAVLLEMIEHVDARYTANWVTNTAHVLRFTLCVLWSLTYTMYLQLRIFTPEYSTERICAAIGDIPTFWCWLQFKFGAKYSTRHPVYAMWYVVPEVYNVVTAPHVQSSIFNWTYLRCYCRYHINSMRVILQTWRKIQCTSSSLRYVSCGSGHIQCNYSSAYSGFNI